MGQYLIFCLQWVFLVYLILFSEGQHRHTEDFKRLRLTTFLCLAFAGIMLPIGRMQDPYIIQTIREDFQCCSRKTHAFKRSITKRMKVKDSLDSFISSAMNIEFVYLILLGIQCMIEQSWDLGSNQRRSVSHSSKQDEVKRLSNKKIKIDQTNQTSTV